MGVGEADPTFHSMLIERSNREGEQMWPISFPMTNIKPHCCERSSRAYSYTILGRACARFLSFSEYLSF